GVRQDLEKPGLEVRAWLELIPRSHRLDERVLDEVLRVGGVPGQAGCDPVERIEVAERLGLEGIEGVGPSGASSRKEGHREEEPSKRPRLDPTTAGDSGLFPPFFVSASAGAKAIFELLDLLRQLAHLALQIVEGRKTRQNGANSLVDRVVPLIEGRLGR